MVARVPLSAVVEAANFVDIRTLNPSLSEGGHGNMYATLIAEDRERMVLVAIADYLPYIDVTATCYDLKQSLADLYIRAWALKPQAPGSEREALANGDVGAAKAAVKQMIGALPQKNEQVFDVKEMVAAIQFADENTYLDCSQPVRSVLGTFLDSLRQTLLLYKFVEKDGVIDVSRSLASFRERYVNQIRNLGRNSEPPVTSSNERVARMFDEDVERIEIAIEQFFGRDGYALG